MSDDDNDGDNDGGIDDGDSMMCCPLSDGGQDEGPSVFSKTEPKARKSYVCYECREPIPVGEHYENAFGVWDKRPDVFKTCLPCVDIREHFSCGNGWVYGEMWEQLRENFFPDMKCGGQCMAGLSPRGKQKRIDERMVWYVEHDEIDDSKWEDWEKRRPT